MNEQMIDVGEVRLHVVTEGTGKPVMLLHGFPEFWYSWRFQIKALADAGYQVIAPDLRGFNLSDKPQDVASYKMRRLVQDVVGLVKALGHERVHLVGHDWGGAAAWFTAAWHPEVVDKLVAMNCCHPERFARALLTPRQLRKSWYMFLFQLPFIPERGVLTKEFVRRAFYDWAVHKENFSDEVLSKYYEAHRQPGAATGMVNWYRAMGRYAWRDLGMPRIDRPTLLIWGEQDKALGPELTRDQERYCSDLRVERIPDASHWVQQDAPEAVNRHLLAFLAGR